MANWADVRREAPELAEQIRQRFDMRKHATIATLRRDGSPRISGTEVEVGDDEWTIGIMPGAVKAADLHRDGRFALHSPTVDPPPDDPSGWPGEAKLAGTAVAAGNPHAGHGPEAADFFRLDITEAVLTRVVGDELEIRSWHAGRGEQTIRRK